MYDGRRMGSGVGVFARGGTRAASRLALLVLLGPACTSGEGMPPPRGAPYETAASGRDAVPRTEVQKGMASWYGAALAGHRTASGERFDPEKMTAAHRTLPLGTWIDVLCVDTGRRVRVRINDRGPFGHADRIVDLSHAAARELGMLRAGVARVELRVVDAP
jgi:peptidoglycan lytic transglycosylase